MSNDRNDYGYCGDRIASPFDFPKYIPAPHPLPNNDPSPRGELAEALDDLEKSLHENSATASDLKGRLAIALRDPFAQDASGPASPFDPSSPLINRLRSLTAHARSNNFQLRELLHRLTV
jgi:hypothetical protein